MRSLVSDNQGRALQIIIGAIFSKRVGNYAYNSRTLRIKKATLSKTLTEIENNIEGIINH